MMTGTPSKRYLTLLAGVALGFFALAVCLRAVRRRPEPLGDPSGPQEAGIASSDLVRPDAIFLVVVDTLRADRLSCYGCNSHETPNIDRLAASGLVFTQAYAVASWTRPSMGAMLTSFYPRQLDLLEKSAPQGKAFGPREGRAQTGVRIPPHAMTAAEMFRSAGFRTAAFVNQPALNFSSTFGRGFDDYFYPASKEEIRLFHPGKKDHLRQGWKTAAYNQNWRTQTHADVSDAMLIEKLHRWLEPQGTSKIFVWLHMLTTHEPHNPPPAFAPTKRADGKQPPVGDLYNGEVRAVDAMIGDLIKAIEGTVGLDRSMIVLTSDHGQELNERGRVGHGHSLHEEVTRVPLIMAAPRSVSARTIDRYVRVIDILPTMLDYAGHADRFPDDAEGVSIANLVDARGPALPVFCEGMLYGNTQRALTQDGYKLILDAFDSSCQLYDLRSDAVEQKDLAGEQPQRVALMKTRMEETRAELQRAVEQVRRQRPDATSPEELQQERNRSREALRSLGYVK